jgi:hypothetical protein
MRSSAVGRDRAIDRAFALRQLPTSMLVMGYRRECLQAAPDRSCPFRSAELDRVWAMNQRPQAISLTSGSGQKQTHLASGDQGSFGPQAESNECADRR